MSSSQSAAFASDGDVIISPIALTTDLVGSSQSLLFIDSGIGAVDTLVQSAAAGSEIYLLRNDADAIDQISATLSGRSGIETIEVVSHGSSGQLSFGSSWLDATNLNRYATQLRSWREALSETADILLYGCAVGAGEAGAELMQQLASLTGADLAASDDLTGHTAQGGDWSLEVVTGDVATAHTLSANAPISFDTVLNNAPVLNLPGPATSYNENAAATLLDALATIADGDSADFDTGTLTVQFTAGSAVGDRLAIRNEGTSATQINLDGANVRYGTTVIGTYLGGTNTDSLVITLNANSNATNVQALLRNLTYNNSSDSLATGNRTIQLLMSDGDGGTSSAVTKTINVTGVNDAPLLAALQTLYDGTASPTQQGWQFGTLPLNAVNPVVVNGGVTIDTSANPIIRSGYARNDIVLDAAAGFALNFQANVLTESLVGADKNGDGKTDRAVFSLTLTTSDAKKAIELGFSQDGNNLRIFAQDDGTQQIDASSEPDSTSQNDSTRQLFTQAEGVTVANPGLGDYSLYVKGDSYTLFLGGNAILSGRLRDYTAAVINLPIPVNPYETPNGIGFADNTPTASGSFLLGQVSILNGGLADVSIAENATTEALSFGTFDVDSNSVSVTSSSSNVVLTPTNTISVGGSDAARTVTVTPSSGRSGTSEITLTANDGSASSSDTFNLTVTPNSGNVQSEIFLRNQRIGASGFWRIQNKSFQSAVTVNNPYDASWNLAVVGDLDGNGINDHVYQKGDQLGYLYFDGANGVTTGVKSTNAPTFNNALFGAVNGQAANQVPGWELVGFANLNGDAQAELIFHNSALDLVAYWNLNNDQVIGGGVITSASAPTGQGTGGPNSGWQVAAVADFTGDQQADFLWRNTGSQQVVLWEMNGTVVQLGESSKSRLLDGVSLSLDFELRGIGDLDGDGVQDAIWRSTTTGVTKFWRFATTGVPTQTEDRSIVASTRYRLAGLADVNQDGRADLIWQDTLGGLVGVWLSNFSSATSDTFQLSDIFLSESGWIESAPAQQLVISDLDWSVEVVNPGVAQATQVA